ncbi:prepilin peptidase [Anaerobacillus arseniciselenatis]|uniref:Prepilin leader peptidase/N-methyltransferase n=1 Tax=Anaerobacillus arseniciselenatis TaxID=85682 RepID=A0A1S2LD36_9BACI|nr:A24 family peptidase [Anaerobacillus arseniciselenatis]OIJ10276.1 prepilin peptidase [Anaerobacillus arseniciselenatis]
MIYIYLYTLTLGLILGSFFNVVGLRVPKNESIVRPRSHCPNCRRTLSTLELVPVFSYLFQKGKCKGCGTKISPIYPFFEAATGGLFVYAFYHFGFQWETIVALVFISLLVIVFISDIHYMIIPDKVLLFFAPILLILRYTIAPLEVWWDPLLGAAIGFILLLAIAVISKGGMGGGDIKLFAVIGIVLGWQGVLLAFFLSTLIGSIIGIIGLATKKMQRGKPIPFGPYIVMATLLVYFFETEILNWYWSLFFVG